MKFIVSSSTLLKQLQQINGVIGPTNVMPILGYFLFVIEKNNLTVSATDLETILKIQLEIEATESGRVCIPTKILMETLKNLPNQPLTFNIDSNFSVEITSDKGKYKIMGEDFENFPKEPDADNKTTFSLKSRGLLNGVNKTIYAVSTEDVRPAMTGVFFELEHKGLTFVGTDAHRLVRYKLKDVTCPKQDSFIVPRKPLTLLKTYLPDNEDEILISYNSNHLFITHGSFELSCRMLDARFPDYKMVIPSENPFRMTIGRLDFQSAVRRVSVFSNKGSNLINLSISGNELHLFAHDADFSTEGNERMACQYNGEDIIIAFKANFLIEMLYSTESEEVNVELSTPTRAGLIKPVDQEENEDLLMLAMPLSTN